MPGEPWRGVVQWGKEVTAGTAVAATRYMYISDFAVTNARSAERVRAPNGSRENTIAIVQGADQVAGSGSMLVSADELVEPMLISLAGGVTPTTPGGATNARLWTFAPSTTLDSATARYNDGANTYIAAGLQGNSITFQGSATGEATVDMEFFGRSRVTGALTGALSHRTPTFLQGWQTLAYIDAFGAAPATTLVSNAVVNHSIQINNALDRVYFYDNTQSAGAITFGEFEVSASVTFAATSAAAVAEVANWDANTPRIVTIKHVGPTDGIETGFERFVEVSVAGHWSEPDLAGEDQGVRTYQMNLMGKYDATNAFSVRVRLQNNRTSAW
jgi:hypothetical protein